jgi:hypothetical protein
MIKRKANDVHKRLLRIKFILFQSASNIIEARVEEFISLISAKSS